MTGDLYIHLGDTGLPALRTAQIENEMLQVVQVACSVNGIDEAVARLTAAGYKVCGCYWNSLTCSH